MAGTGAFAQFQYQISYLNISRPSGGPVATGDIIEIRAVISVPSGTSITKLNYASSVPGGTSFVSGSLKTVTNEGVVVGAIPTTGNYTDAAGDDVGTLAGSNITINIGTGATSNTGSGGGSVTGGSTQPVFQANASIFMPAYRVQVTAASGSTISIASAFRYKDASNNNQTKNLSYNIFVSPAYTCSANATTNLVSAESAGSFGSGTTLNRGSSSTNVSGFSFVALSTTAPVDGAYCIVNNTSGTGYSGGSPASSDKVWGVWDVIGDHTGTSNGTGNPPAAPGTNKGYMLVVNASFAPGVVFSTTVGGLFTNSTYTLSFWVRNICPICGSNPQTGANSGTPGVKPNLSFDIGSNNYFSTGDIAYSGQWVKESFTFNTGAATSVNVTLKNNAPGGGGNDWVLDDLAVTQCLMLLPVTFSSLQASRQPDGNLLTWETSAENGIDHYYIERSTDGFHFLTIGDRTPKGAAGAAYYFADQQTGAGQTVYYRLRMTDKEGRISYSDIITLKADGSLPMALHIMPNPAKSYTNVYIKTQNAGFARIILLNTAGIEVYRQSVSVTAGQNAVRVEIPSSLPRGLYIVQTRSGETTVNNKLVLE
ncbi:MAG: T9SS type A sorting domain-containing protein [Bacteroidetes bacterium]|nr:T9SS type A sorting domain-containing protein [Bacteroidota bacterium]